MTASTRTATHTVETLDTPAPNGHPAVKITCLCEVCTGRGWAAIVNKALADQHDLGRQTKRNHTLVHNYVLLANGPLARVASQVRSGPWAA